MMLKGTPWYEQYANLDQYLKADADCMCLSQSISFLNEHPDITVKELPLVFAFMWTIKSENSILYHMKEKYDMIAPSDLIAFILFTEALLKKKGRIDISRTRYIALFTVFQYLLNQKMTQEVNANELSVENIKLFDFDAYNAIYSRLKGCKLTD